MTENTAAITALETAAKALTDAVAALKGAPASSRVGESYNLNNAGSRAALDTLPVGSKVTDRDGDTWEKDDNGEWGVYGSSGDTSAMSVLNYTPITVIKVGDEPKPVEPSVKVGDTVRIVAGFFGGPTASVVGLKGRLDRITTEDGRTKYVVEPGFNASEVAVVTPAQAEPVSDGRVDFIAAYGLRNIRVEPSVMTYSAAAYLNIAGKAVHLTKDEARKIGEALLALANG